MFSQIMLDVARPKIFGQSVVFRKVLCVAVKFELDVPCLQVALCVWVGLACTWHDEGATSFELPTGLGWGRVNSIRQVLHWTGPLKPWRHHGVNRKLWEPHTRECALKQFFGSDSKGLKRPISHSCSQKWARAAPDSGERYCPQYSFREHTTTCRPDSWFC